MPRSNIENLRLPKELGNTQFDATSRIETASQAIKETKHRLKLAKKVLRDGPPSFININDLTELIVALERSLAGEDVRSPACPIYMLDQRIRIVSECTRLAHEAGAGNRTVVHIIPPKLIVDGGKLGHTNGRKLMESLRTDLNRCGAKEADGWLFAALHGEHEPCNSLQKPHYHLIATGGMIAVADKLRRMKKYAPQLVSNETGKRVDHPIRVIHQEITDLLHAISYVLKSFWPSRYVGPVGDSGKVKRSTRLMRIPEPYHTEVMIWLNTHSLSDLTLLMGIRVYGSRLVSS